MYLDTKKAIGVFAQPSLLSTAASKADQAKEVFLNMDLQITQHTNKYIFRTRSEIKK